MAQDSDKKPSGAVGAGPEHDDDEQFHYYSGGEIKELADTQLSKWYLAFIVVLIVICVAALWYCGAIPGLSRYKPMEGSSQSLAAIRADLATRDAAAGNVSSIDLDRLPAPLGQTETTATSAGSDVYQQYCIGCHGPNQDGNGPNAASLNPKPRNFRDAAFMQSMSLERINQSIHRGVPGTAMPHWEDVLNEKQIRDVIFYVWSLTTPKAPAADAGAAPAPAAPATLIPQNSANAASASTTKTFAPGTTPPAPVTAPAPKPASAATTP
jgi:mono/diheme cytochrome c family protein